MSSHFPITQARRKMEERTNIEDTLEYKRKYMVGFLRHRPSSYLLDMEQKFPSLSQFCADLQKIQLHNHISQPATTEGTIVHPIPVYPLHTVYVHTCVMCQRQYVRQLPQFVQALSYHVYDDKHDNVCPFCKFIISNW